MIWDKKLTSERLFAFALYFRRARLFLAFAMVFLFGSLASFAGISQIDSANKLVTQMMVEVESILAKDLNDDIARHENVLALFETTSPLYWTTAPVPLSK